MNESIEGVKGRHRIEGDYISWRNGQSLAPDNACSLETADSDLC